MSKAGRSNPPRRMRSSMSAATSHSRCPARTPPSTSRATALMRAPARRNVSSSTASLRILAASTSRSAGTSAPARRDGVSRSAAVSAVEPLHRQVGGLEPDAGNVESSQERGQRRVVGRVDLDQPAGPGSPGATSVSTSVDVAAVGDEHDARPAPGPRWRCSPRTRSGSGYWAGGRQRGRRGPRGRARRARAHAGPPAGLAVAVP